MAVLEARLEVVFKMLPKCEAFHRGVPPRQANLHPMLVGGPGERWAIDLAGPHPAVNGYKYMMTAICCFSKFGVCIPIRNKEASTACSQVHCGPHFSTVGDVP